jgi:hypothetical protein
MSREGWVDTDDTEDTDDDWDQEFADELLGSLVVIGITYREPDGKVTREQQIHGYIRTVDRHMGITLKPEGDDEEDEFNLPPLLEVFERAEPGIYTDDAGNRVSDPDFVAYFSVTSPTS